MAMRVLNKIADLIFPVVDLPEDKRTQNELKEYFEEIEKEKAEAKGIKGEVILSIVIMGLNGWLFMEDDIEITNKILLLIPQFILSFKIIYLLIYIKLERRSLKIIDLKEKFLLSMLLLLLITGGNVGLAFFSTGKTMQIGAEGVAFIIIIGQICYFACYVMGYRIDHGKIIESLLQDKKEGRKKIIEKRGGIAIAIPSSLVLLTYRYHIIPEIILILIICTTAGITLFAIAKISVRNRFFCKLYEKELK